MSLVNRKHGVKDSSLVKSSTVLVSKLIGVEYEISVTEKSTTTFNKTAQILC